MSQKKISSPGFFIDMGYIEEYFRSPAFRNQFMKYLDQALTVVYYAIKKRLPQGSSGELKRSLRKSIVTLPNGSTIGRVVIPLSSPAYKYAKFVEYGRRKGKMPPCGRGSTLYKWVEKKVIAKLHKQTGRTPRKTPSRDALVLSVSFAIAKTIARKGTYSNPEFPLPQAFQMGWVESQHEAQRIIEYGISAAIAGMAV